MKNHLLLKMSECIINAKNYLSFIVYVGYVNQLVLNGAILFRVAVSV